MKSYPTGIVFAICLQCCFAGCATTYFAEPKRASDHATLKCESAKGVFGGFKVAVREINGQRINNTWKGTSADRKLPPGETTVLIYAIDGDQYAEAALDFNAVKDGLYLADKDDDGDLVVFKIVDTKSGKEVAIAQAEKTKRPQQFTLPIVFF